jgi:hydroxyacylglutathione hydrolase
VVHTHAHFDHILASGNLKKSTGCRLSLHPEDRLLWDHLEDQCRLFGVPYSPLPAPDSDLNHEEELHVGTFLGKALHTPGHTPGSMSFHFPEQKLLIAGDTLFRGSIGRTDLWGGDFSKINNSIRNILYRLDEETTVVTGHGPQTTIGYELRHNQIIRGV